MTLVLLHKDDPSTLRPEYKHRVSFTFVDGDSLKQFDFGVAAREMATWLHDGLSIKGALLADYVPWSTDEQRHTSNRYLEYGFLTEEAAVLFKLTFAGYNE